MKTITPHRISLGITILMMAIGAQRMEGSTVYYYTGNPFTTTPLPFVSGDEVIGNFTVLTPLADNLTFASVTPNSYTFTDGPDTLTNITGIGGFQISTDGRPEKKRGRYPEARRLRGSSLASARNTYGKRVNRPGTSMTARSLSRTSTTFS